MNDSRIPDDVRALLVERIHSFEQLEALLLLRREPRQSWDAHSVSVALKMTVEASIEALDQLRASRLVAEQPGPQRQFRYSPGERALDVTVGRLVVVYDEARLEIIRLMNRNAVDRLRSSAIRTFADSFLFKKKDDVDE
jgi:hypothetical protein